MRCPSCKLENPTSAEYCDCGYEFVPGSKPKEWKRVYHLTPIIPPGLITVRLVLLSWGIGALAIPAFVALGVLEPETFEIFAYGLLAPAFVWFGGGMAGLLLMIGIDSLFFGVISLVFIC